MQNDNLSINALVCDTCYTTVPLQGGLIEEYIGWPCPDCGESLLTAADYKAAKKLTFWHTALKFFGLAKDAQEDRPPNWVAVKFHVVDGKTKILK